MRDLRSKAVCVSLLVALTSGLAWAQSPGPKPAPGGSLKRDDLRRQAPERLPGPELRSTQQWKVEVTQIYLSPSNPYPGREMFVNVDLKNSGTAAAERVGYEITLNGAVIASWEQPRIAAGETLRQGVTWVAAPGTATFAVAIKRVGNIPLLNVGKTLQVTIAPAPSTGDLTLVGLEPYNRGGGGIAFHSPDSLTGRVTLSGVAPQGGVVVALSSSAPSLIVVPPTVTVPTGQGFATFPISPAMFNAKGQATVTAMLGGTIRTIDLWITPGTEIQGFDLSTPSVIGGRPVTGTLRLYRPAPAGGAVLTLVTGTPSLVTAPSSLTFAAGQQEVTFQLTTQPVTTPTGVGFEATSPLVPGSRRYRELTLTPATAGAQTTGGVQIARVDVISPIGSFMPSTTLGAGQVVGVALTLTAPAPGGGAVVTLSSSHPDIVPVPASLLITDGLAESTPRPTLRIATRAVAATTAVTLSATYGGTTRTATVTVQQEATVSAVSVAPASVAGGGVVTGTVTLNQAAPPSGTPVTLTSSGAAAMVPASVTVGAGLTSASFSIATRNVSAAVSVGISAAFAGVSRSATVEVRP
jgi:hypothetical protein